MENQPQTQVQPANGIAEKRSLIPLLFAATIILFFFNFFTVKCDGDKVQEIRGIDLVLGSESKAHTNPTIDNPFTQKAEESKIPSSPWAMIALGAAIIGLGAYLIKEKREAHIGVIAGVVGLGSLLILQNVIKKAIEKEADGVPASVELEFAYWGALIALGIAGYISYLRLQKAKSNAAKAAKEGSVNQFESTFDLGAWIGRNKKVVFGLIIAGAAIYGVYYVVLRSDPTSDGKKFAKTRCDCTKEHLIAQKKICQEFINKFDIYNFKSRHVAIATLDTLLVRDYKDFKINFERINLHNEKLKEKYAVDKDQIEKFEYAFNAQLELCKLDEQNQQFQELKGQAEAKIKTIIGLPEKINDILAKEFGYMYTILTDGDRNYDKYDIEEYIVPNRKNNEYFPYLINGDFNGDGALDYAAQVHDNNVGGERLAIIWGNGNSIEISDEGCSAISLQKGNCDVGYDPSVHLKYDAIQVTCFGKGSWVLYWDGSSFKKIWTSC